MVYITGDTHGKFERIQQFCESLHTTKDDILIILGDAGINYYENGSDRKLKKKLEKLSITLLCIHGNHEQRPENIDTYKEYLWRGGVIYMEEKYPSILFAKDGETYDFDGENVLALGGAYSVDKYYRLINGLKWFADEQPSPEIKHRVSEKLCDLNWEVDVVLSHTCPIKYEPTEVFLPFVDQSMVDKSTEEWLGKIEEQLSYDKWYCAHYHTEKVIDKIEFLYESIKVFN